MSVSNVQISELGKIVTGKTPSTKKAAFFKGEYQFVTPSDIDWKNYYCKTTTRTVTDQARNAHKNQFIPGKSVMVTCIGNTIGKCAISSGYCLTNQQINSIIPYSGIDPLFVYYLLIHNIPAIRGVGLGGGAATPILNKSAFSRVKLSVPSRESWAGIASILSTYDNLIENNRRRIELLEQSARLLYKEWFVHLRFPGHEHVKIVDGVPEGWESKKIAEVCETVGGGTPSTKVSEYWEGDITWVVPSDITKNDCLALLDSERKITEKGLRESSAKMVPAETILMTSRASVGFFALMDVEVCTNQGQRRDTWTVPVRLFNDNSQALYKTPGRLIINITESGFKYDVEINRSGSEGVSKMKVYCFDLMLLQLMAQQSDRLDFLVHDSGLYDGVDERQRALALERASEITEQTGTQYICALNSDMVPRAEFTDGFDFDKHVRLTLTDKNLTDTLLGFHFERPSK